MVRHAASLENGLLVARIPDAWVRLRRAVSRVSSVSWTY
jgi:hypothetical protein